MHRQLTPPAPAAAYSGVRSPRPEPRPVSVPPPAPPAETMAGLRTDALAGLLTATVIQRSAADTAVGGPTVQRKKTVDMATVNAKSALKASIGGKTASDVKKRLEKRFPKGPLFDASDLLAIQTLEASAEGKKYLAEVGIGLYTEAVTISTPPTTRAGSSSCPASGC